jgi:DNA repair protein RecO (recombination protein O)
LQVWREKLAQIREYLCEQLAEMLAFARLAKAVIHLPPLTTAAIVLRFANYRDHDRMLTLLSPAHGRIDAMARGCRRPKSPLLPASELFTAGEYVLLQKGDRHIVVSCSVHEPFYPLRLEYERLNHGALLAGLCEAAARPGERCEPLFEMLIRALNHLAYRQSDPASLAASFMLHYASFLGYLPELRHCVICEASFGESAPLFFSTEEGGAVCKRCAGHTCRPLRYSELLWLRHVYAEGFDSYQDLNDGAPYTLMLEYVSHKTERRPRSARLINNNA